MTAEVKLPLFCPACDGTGKIEDLSPVRTPVGPAFTHLDPNFGFYDGADVSLSIVGYRVTTRWSRGESIDAVIKRLKIELSSKVAKEPWPGEEQRP